jgi:hypothetical protein
MVLISSSHKFKAMLCQHTSKQPLFYNDTQNILLLSSGWNYTCMCWKSIAKLLIRIDLIGQEELPRPSILTWIHCSRCKLKDYYAILIVSIKRTRLCRRKESPWSPVESTWMGGWHNQNHLKIWWGISYMDVGLVQVGSGKMLVLMLTFILKMLQCEQHDTLTPEEMEAAQCLLWEDLDDDQSNSSRDEGDNDDIVMSPCTHAEANKQRRLSVQRKTESPCVECSYILGSVAEVETLWSLAKYVMPHH